MALELQVETLNVERKISGQQNKQTDLKQVSRKRESSESGVQFDKGVWSFGCKGNPSEI